MTNKHTIIVLISLIVIVGSVGYSGLNMVSLPVLQFSWPGNQFNYLSVMTDKTVNVCNDSPLPASFSKYSFTIIYGGKELGTYITGNGAFASHTSGQIYGKFDSDNDSVSALFFSFFDTANGGTEVARINMEKLHIRTKLDSTILWVIPYSITNDYSGSEFLNMINTKLSCK